MRKKIKEIIPIDVINPNGIFKALQDYDVPWKALGINNTLDIEYIYNHSGEKMISPLMNKIMVEPNFINVAAKIIYDLYIDKWNKVYYAYFTKEYDPLSNYDMIEEGRDITNSEGTDISTLSGTDVVKNDGSSTRSGGADTSISAFNSSNLSKVSSIEDDTKDVIKNDTTTNYGRKDTISHDNDTEMNHRLTRKGNIGVTTSQQMLQSEIELRKYNFFNEVFLDVDSIITLDIY